MAIIDRYKAAVFDFDFTLVDASKGIILCYNNSFRDFGLPLHSDDEIKATIGLTVEESYCILTKTDDREKGKEFRRHFLTYANQYMTVNTKFLPGAEEFLVKLKEKGIKTGIVSTKRGMRIKEFFAKYPEIMPDVIIGSDDGVPLKPEPDGIFAVCDYFKENFGIEKRDCLYFGDNEVDAIAAERAQIDFAALTTGTTDAQTLAKHKTVGVFEKLAETL